MNKLPFDEVEIEGETYDSPLWTLALKILVIISIGYFGGHLLVYLATH